ncbi:MAG: metallophosphoesterase [Myxococcales bacterium]|nr:metallophosphoesterase [Myxococcales bacterium]
MPADAITWLHLSDFHADPLREEPWPELDFELESDLGEMAEHLGPPDLVILSGDLTAHGRPAELELVDALLERLERWLGRRLLVVAVPGNHDLLRPASPWRYVALREYDEHPSLHRDLWEQGEPLLDPLFAPYQQWARRRVIEPLLQQGHEVHVSPRIPGDLSVVLDKGQTRLGLVGLNTAWASPWDGAEGQLQLRPEQLLAALPPGPAGDPLAWFHDVDAALLITHHPRSWLSPRCRKLYKSRIHPPGRFALALCGHQHEPWGELASSARPRAVYQVPSLYGRAHLADGRERTMGYAWGRRSADGRIRVWPRRRSRRKTGRHGLDPDLGFQHEEDALGGVELVGPAG